MQITAQSHPLTFRAMLTVHLDRGGPGGRGTPTVFTLPDDDGYPWAELPLIEEALASLDDLETFCIGERGDVETMIALAPKHHMLDLKVRMADHFLEMFFEIGEGWAG